MMKFRALLAAVIATILGLVLGTVAVQSASVFTAVEVPTCVKPNATSSQQQNHQKAYDYAKCLADRQEALLGNSHPVPTVTETVTQTATVTASPSPTSTTTSSPTPTPTEPAGTCVKPDATNTGTTGTLTADGRTTFNTAGEVIENKRLTGDITIGASNVTLKNVQVDGGIYIGDDITGVKLNHVRAESAGVVASANVIIEYSHFKAIDGDALYVSAWGGTQVTNLTVRHNFIDRPTFTSTEAHWDGIQMRGVNDVLISCNNFDVGAWQFEYNVLIYSEPAFDGNYNIVVDGNWLNGGNFAFMGGTSDPVGYEITNNKLRSADFHFGLCYPGGGLTAQNIDQVVQTGNTLDGAPLAQVCKASDF